MPLFIVYILAILFAPINWLAYILGFLVSAIYEGFKAGFYD